jgi:hypothetical protein
MTHDLISHADGWRCTLCHAVFMSTMLLEEIMTNECAGRPLVLGGTEIPVVVDPSTVGFPAYLYNTPDEGIDIFNTLAGWTSETVSPAPLSGRRVDTAIRKGERLLDAWEKERGEGNE